LAITPEYSHLFPLFLAYNRYKRLAKKGDHVKAD